jgi:hypothetical protein
MSESRMTLAGRRRRNVRSSKYACKLARPLFLDGRGLQTSRGLCTDMFFLPRLCRHRGLEEFGEFACPGRGWSSG